MDKGWEFGEEESTCGAGRGGAAGFGVAGRVEVGVDVGLGAEVGVGEATPDMTPIEDVEKSVNQMLPSGPIVRNVGPQSATVVEN